MKSQENPNNFSIGKYLRKKKRLYKSDDPAATISPGGPLQRYINYLVENGTYINKIGFAEFQLKNGLKYPGLIAKDKVITDEIMLRVPKSLILNTRRAFLSDIKNIFLENPKFFSSCYTSSWEDHVLLVFLLNEYSKGEQSEWHHMISNLSREIDYIVFWKEEELELLEDPILCRMAKNHRKFYDEEEAFVLELPKRYPDLLKPEAFTKDNIRWIYTHLVTRCFGKYLEYTTMVPFAEFYNHECVDVYYDLEYSINNLNTPEDYSMKDAKEKDQNELDGYDSSDGSNGSEDEEFDSDFEYEKDELHTENEAHNQIAKKLHGLDLQDNIRLKNDDIENMLVFDFDWGDGFSIFFVRGVYQETAKVIERYKTKQINLTAAQNLITSLETSVVIFKNETRRFYNKAYRMKEEDFITAQTTSFVKIKEEKEEKEKEQKLASKPAEELFDPDEEWKEDTFDHFVMKTSSKEQFDKNSQLFFCYGRLSNRCALLRYGIALEYNKYEHVHLKIPYLKYIKDTDWLVDKVKSFHLSRYMRFKLKRTKVNISLINFCKGIYFQLDYGNSEALLKPINLDLELLGIRKAQEFLTEYLETFSYSPEDNKEIMQDPETGYHEYFAAVFRLERQRLVTFHLRALAVLEQIVKRMKKGLTFEFSVMRVHDLETNEECNRNRIFLLAYLDMINENWIDKHPKAPKFIKV